MAQQIAGMYSGGVDRYTINWAYLEPSCTLATAIGVCLGSPGPINWTYLDAVVGAFHSHGIRLVGQILAAPKWAWSPLDCGPCLSDPTSVAMPPVDSSTGLGYLDSFLTQVVGRYDSMYPGEFLGYEIWNEENVKSFWPTSTGPDAARYTRLLCSAHSAIAGVDRSMPVAFGGLAYVSTPSTKAVGIPAYLSTAYGNGARACMSAMAFHAYPGVLAPDAAGNPFLAAHSQILQAEADGGDSGRVNWVTEFGYCTANQTGGDCSPVTQTDQADFLECGYQLAAGMPDIQLFIVHTLDDGPTSSYQNSDEAYGAYNYPGSPKLSVTMFSKLFALYGASVPAITSCSAEFDWQA